MSKKAKETIKELIAKIVKSGESQFLWDWRFDITKVAQRFEFRGFKGEDLWRDELIELALVPFREHAKRQGYDEAQVDECLKIFAEKIGVAIDRIRKRFYAFELEQPAKEIPTETKPPEEKPVEKPRAETKSPEATPPEEIELEEEA